MSGTKVLESGLNIVGEMLSVRIRVDYDGARLSHVTELFFVDEVRDCLAQDGLHVVSAADKAVLDACAALSDGSLRWLVRGTSVDIVALAEAEFARRGVKA